MQPLAHSKPGNPGTQASGWMPFVTVLKKESLMKKMRMLATAALIAATPFVASTAMAQNTTPATVDKRPSLNLDAEASTRVPEDTAWAQFSVEKESKDQAQAQQLGKTALADVLATAKKSSTLQVTTENLFTTPVYNKDGKVTSWRTQFNVQLE